MNPLFQQMNNNSFQGFVNFMQQMKGQNPHDIINNLVSSGKVSQQQLADAQNKAKQIESQMGNLKNMFGF